MNSSIGISASAQPQPQSIPQPTGYIATSGQDLLETGITLVWTPRTVIEVCRQSGEDAALWMIRDGCAPQLVAAIRPAPKGDPSVQWL